MSESSIKAGDNRISDVDQSLELVRQSGNRLMSFSGISYSGRMLQIDEQPDVHLMEFGSGHPVLLIHGGGGGSAVWHRQIAALAQDFRVIAPDLPMFGLSAIPSRIDSIRDNISRLILRIMDTLEVDRAHIVGHSLGGLSAIGALIKAPHRFDKVALGASAGLGYEVPWVYRAASIPAIGEVLAVPNHKVHSNFFKRYAAVLAQETDESREVENYYYLVMARRGRYRRLLEGLRLFSDVRGQRDIISDRELESVEHSTLVIWGSHDRFFPEAHYKRAISEIPSAEGIVIPNCGHLPVVDAPERYTEMLSDWFNRP